jgi:hypothetical protein
MAMHNMDDVIIQQGKADPEPDVEVKGTQLEVKEPETVEESDVKEPEAEETDKKLTYLEQYQKDKEDYLGKSDESDESDSDLEQKPEKKTKKSDEKDEELDEFGSKTEKPRTYTEEEVQRMIRERLARGQQPVQQAAQDFKADPSSEESWEQQLETFVTNTVQKLGQKQQQEQWQQQEQRVQAEFETRFTAGMTKYKDFQEVVANKPITNGIMMAARSMKDPAAFLYAASKQQPKELERIAQIQDPYVLAAEVGRLEERMRKAKTVSAAPKPGSKTKSDMSEKYTAKVTVDDKIRQHAQRKLVRR